MEKNNYENEIRELTNFCKVLTTLIENDMKIQLKCDQLLMKMIASDNTTANQRINYSSMVSELSKISSNFGNRSKQNLDSIKAITKTIDQLVSLQDKLL